MRVIFYILLLVYVVLLGSAGDRSGKPPFSKENIEVSIGLLLLPLLAYVVAVGMRC